MRPDSIRNFDRLYLGAVALSMVSFVLTYSQVTAMLEAELAGSGAEDIGGTALIIGIGIGTLISLGLWYLVSRMRIEFIKWILILLLVYSLAGVPQSLEMGFGLSTALGLVGLAMQAGAIWFLGRPDAKAWFAEKRG
ncbi:hypothetical protein [Alteraurantiacibacter aquimixticola]|uniref:DUF2127 domain-containing protein n=1 Tax=Alteraurantiacibacter aquimixticola TaxID=2489173 RepID=A0A4T3EX97_9SPHN|nr:hypothetical protein [Alteraurantiacibacter aquimixticola]TIX49088.1 hypothetical protein E5222_15300 [Alteraurantiacibacter aquimixticola]